jgi:hypothetical protein
MWGLVLKTGLAVSCKECVQPKLFKMIRSFLGLATKSNYVLY